MNEHLSNYFFEETSKVFSFLVDEYSFANARLEIDNKIHCAFVLFVGKNLSIEFILDERENNIDCKIARVIDGKKTIFYAVDNKGLRVRESLSGLLRRRGFKDRLFSKVGGLEIHELIKITLADFAQMLKKHGLDVLSDSPTALD